MSISAQPQKVFLGGLSISGQHSGQRLWKALAHRGPCQCWAAQYAVSASGRWNYRLHTSIFPLLHCRFSFLARADLPTSAPEAFYVQKFMKSLLLFLWRADMVNKLQTTKQITVNCRIKSRPSVEVIRNFPHSLPVDHFFCFHQMIFLTL